MARPKSVGNSPIVDIAKLDDVAQVKAAIKEKYDFDVTDEYAADLIVFLEEIAEEMTVG